MTMDKQDLQPLHPRIVDRGQGTALRLFLTFLCLPLYVSYQTWGVNGDNFILEVGMRPIGVDETTTSSAPRRTELHARQAQRRLLLLVRRRGRTRERPPTRLEVLRRRPDRAFVVVSSTTDLQTGLHRFTAPRLSAGVNFYYMSTRTSSSPAGMVQRRRRPEHVNVPRTSPTPRRGTFGENHRAVHGIGPCSPSRRTASEPVPRRAEKQPHLRPEPGRHDHHLLT